MVLYRVVGEDIDATGRVRSAPNAFTVTKGDSAASLTLADVLDGFPFDATKGSLFFYYPNDTSWRSLERESEAVPLVSGNTVRMRFLPDEHVASVGVDAVHAKLDPSDDAGAVPRRLSSGDGVSVSNVGAQIAKGFGKAKNLFASWARKGAEMAQKGAEMASKYASGTRMVIGNKEIFVKKKLAEGGFSEVFVAVDTEGEKFALKKCLVQEKNQLASAKREMAAHRAVSSPNVLKLIASCVVDSKRVPRAKEAFMLFPPLRCWHAVGSHGARSEQARDDRSHRVAL